jgi:hypothetical protein
MSLSRNLVIIALVFSLLSASVAGAASSGTIPPGTVINKQNWQQYKQFMSYGMQVFWGDAYHWRFPDDYEVVIGPTHHYAMGSRQYIENTERYASQVRIVDLSNGGHNLENYTAGLPFPNPREPMKGWKVLVNDWFAYQPYELCGDRWAQWFQDRFGNVSNNTVLGAGALHYHLVDLAARPAAGY